MQNYFNQSIGHGLSQRKAPVLSKGPPLNPGVLSNHTDILGIPTCLEQGEVRVAFLSGIQVVQIFLSIGYYMWRMYSSFFPT